MSANNFIAIQKVGKKYKVSNVDADGCGSFVIGTAKTFKEAREMAYKYMEEGNPVEYGIKINEECYND